MPEPSHLPRIQPSPAAHSRSGVTLHDATDADSAAWDRFVASRPEGSFYHLFGWRRVLQSSLGLEPVFLLARERGEIVGVLPMVLLSSRLFGRILCSMPFLNYGGPCASSDAATRFLIDAAVERADALAVKYLELRCAQAAPTELAVSTRKVSMTIQLVADPEVLWNGFKHKHRKNVRRAMKNDVSITSGGAELLDEFYAVLERSWRDLGTPLYRRDFFQAIVSEFPDKVRLYVCRHQGRAVATAWNGMQGGVWEGMWLGALPAARDLSVIHVLYWQMIQDACLRGDRLYHLGRSTAGSGSEWFKSRWNAEAQQLYWYFHRADGGAMPELNVDNPKYRLAIAAWKRLPLWLVRQLGPAIARSIP
jgi:FemAB-related protein (PEP-CTERM system-associated)